MPIYEMTPKNIREYKQFISDVRKELNMSQEEFAQTVIQYSGPDSDGKYSCHVHRNSVMNWESPHKSCIPMNQETFISVALLKVRGTLGRTDQSPEERQKCYEKVTELYRQYMGMNLHPWYLPDVVMIEAVRGIYSMEEVPEVIDRMKELIGRRGLQANIQDAMPGSTDGIQSDLDQVFCDQDLVNTIQRWADQFTFGYGVVGSRMKVLFDERQSSVFDKAPRLGTMVAVYAPKQRNSYQKMYDQVCSVSRSWLLDLCIHMRFSRKEINKILYAARYMGLQENREDPEYCIRNHEGAPVGSVKWYLEEDVEAYYRNRNSCRYENLTALSPGEKAALILLIAESIRKGDLQPISGYGDPDEIRLPIDYFLDYVPWTKKGQRLFKEVWNRLPATSMDGMQKKLDGWTSRLYSLILDNIPDKSSMNNAEKKLYDDYVSEFREYYEMPAYKRPAGARAEASALYLFAAIVYSVCTGSLWSGSLPEGLNMMKVVKAAFPEKSIGSRAVILLYNVMAMMLGQYPLSGRPGKGVCIDSRGSAVYFSMDKVTHDLRTFLRKRS